MEIEKLEEYKIQNCFHLRQPMATIITVLSGGIAGLFFVENSIWKGVFYSN